MVVNKESQRQKARKEFSLRLKEALSAAGYVSKQRPLSEKYGVQSESARKWLSGGSIPEHDIIKQLARDCNVNPQWLEYGEGPRAPGWNSDSEGSEATYVGQSDFVHKLPLLPWPAIDDWLEKGVWSGDRAPAINAPSESCFALVLRDDSMQSSVGPSLANGYIVVIDPSQQPHDRQIVLVKTASGHVIRKIDLTDKLLIPLNQRYPIAPISGQIIGVAIDCFVGDISSIID